MKYKHIIFDIDGTMLDSSFADLTSLHRVLLELEGIDYPLDDLRFALGIPGEVALTHLPIKDIKRANNLWTGYMRELSHTMQLFDGVRELIINLKLEGVNLGIITSKNKIEYKNDFIPFGLDDYFDTVICIDDCTEPKPSPQPMYAYMNQTKANPCDILYIGDTIYDKECASNANVDFGIVLWSNSNDIFDTKYRFNTPNDILNLK